MAVISNTGNTAADDRIGTMQFAGAPTSGTSGTYAGKVKKGTLLVDTTNGNLYINSNTAASPTWSLIAHA